MGSLKRFVGITLKKMGPVGQRIHDRLSPTEREFRQARSMIDSVKVSYLKLQAARSSKAQLEIGSGPTKREGWLTLDMCRGADVYWDLRDKLPFEESCFDRVYCSHVLEHFVYHDLKKLLKEVYRVLRPDGEFLIAVPDASIYVDAYMGKRDAAELIQYKPAITSTKSMDILNYMFYMDGHHKFMFDAENLAFHCEAAGFVNCASRPFDPSLDMADRDYESLYMSCHKPQRNA